MEDLEKIIKDEIEKNRKKLLDLSMRNNLLNFKRSALISGPIRIVNNSLNNVYTLLQQGKELTIKELPNLPNEPLDEITPKFIKEYNDGLQNDETYLQELEKIKNNPEATDEDTYRIQRELKDRIRVKLGLPERVETDIPPREWAKKIGINPNFENTNYAIQSADLQTLLYENDLVQKTKKLYKNVDTLITQKGVNPLYIALGFLEWNEKETDTNDGKKYAPLMLIRLKPEKLKKKINSKNNTYSISVEDRKLDLNASLKYKLLNDFDIKLPNFADSDTPESYLEKVEDIIKNQKGWKIKRFIMIGRFLFSRIAMYEDLDLKRWDIKKVSSNSGIKRIFTPGSVSYPNDSEPDDGYNIDKGKEATDTILVSSADASQHSAIIEANKKESMVIQGPPGTGKSQTITNLIANALYKGKKVLFVAEKLSALNVVYDRLKKSKLEDFCLELHSDKVNMKKIQPLLEKSFNEYIKKNRTKYSVTVDNIEELKTKKCLLRDYYDFLGKKIGNIGISFNDALWNEKIAEDNIENNKSYLLDIKIKNADKIDNNEYKEIIDIVKRLKNAQKSYLESINTSKNKQHFEFHNIFNSQDVNDLCDKIIQLNKIISDKYEILSKLTKDIISSDDLTIEKIIEIKDQTQNVYEKSNGAQLDYSLLQELNSNEKIEKVTKITSKIRNYASLQNDFLQKTKDGKKLPRDIVNQITNSIKDLIEINQNLSEYKVDDLQNMLLTISNVTKNQDLYKRVLQIINCNENDISLQFIANEILDKLSKVNGNVINYLDDKNVISPVNTPILQEISNNIETKNRIKQELKTLKDIDRFSPTEIKTAYNIIKDESLFNKLSYRYWKAKLKVNNIFITKLTSGQQLYQLQKLIDYHKLNDKIYKSAQFNNYITNNENSIYDLLRANKLYQDLRAIEFNSNVSKIQQYSDFWDNIDILKLQNIYLVTKSYIHTEIDSKVVNILQKTPNVKNDMISKIQNYINLVSQNITSGLSVKEIKEVCNDFEKIFALQKDIESLIKKLNIPELATKLNARRGIIEVENTNNYAEVLNKLNINIDSKNKLFTNNGKKEFENIKTIIDEASKIADDIRNRISNINYTVKIKFTEYFPQLKSLYNIPINKYCEILDDILSLKNFLFNKCSYQIERNDAQKTEIAELLNILDKNNINYERLEDYFNFVFYHNLIKNYSSEKWMNYKPDEYANICQKVRDLDTEIYTDYQKLLINNIIDNISENKNNTEIIGNNSNRVNEKTGLGLIDHIVNNSAKSKPIREILEKSGRAIQLLKPCFLMSPISVAQYLVPEKIDFDLLIIDEASQMYFEEALGAVLRCNQYIIVGDDKQLPPTSFFQTISASDEDSDDETITTTDASILEICQQRNFTQKELLWHYRSKDDTLINFSNHHFYHDYLNIFPSTISPEEKAKYETGIELKYISDGIYKSGKKTNLREVEEIIKSVRDFATNHSNKSLGIVATNSSQQNLIDSEIEKLKADDPRVKAYCLEQDKKQEPLFVKNLESVQGDERDYIFISTVYGPESICGKVMQRFGPINGEYGHRRLNVLITRAKYGIKLFTSLKSSDIDVTPTSSKGLEIFKNYLAYAETGKLELGTNTFKETESPFEQAVMRILQNRGYEVDAQVGCKGFRIDLAVRHPLNTSVYAVGIECDGAPYHSSKSARDRDCIRQQILEAAGWKIYRIWSTDWYHNTDREIEKLLDYIKNETQNSPNIQLKNITNKEDEITNIIDETDEPELFDDEIKADTESEYKIKENTAQVGDLVEYEQNGKIHKYRIVNTVGNLEKGEINESTPIASALLEKSENEEVDIETPNSSYTVIIKKITKGNAQ